MATDREREQAERLALPVVEGDQPVIDPARAVATARGALTPGPFAVLVDVLDVIDAPLAENTSARDGGPTIENLEVALAELWTHPDCGAVSIGELDPTHAAADPSALPRFGAAPTRALRVVRGGVTT